MISRIFLIPLIIAIASISASGQTIASSSVFDPLSYGVVLEHPDMKKVTIKKDITYLKTPKGDLHMDVYLPPNLKKEERRPAIIFLNTIGDTPGERKVKSWGIYTSWPTLMAANGYIGITMEAESALIQESVRGLFTYLSDKGSELNINTGQLGVYAASANVNGALQYLMNEKASKGIKAAVLYYGLSPTGAFRKDLPVFYVVAEADARHTDYSRVWTEVLKNHAPWTIRMASDLPHAFDAYSDNDNSRKVIKETIAFWKTHLDPVEQRSVKTETGRELVTLIHNDPPKAIIRMKEFTDQHPSDINALKILGALLSRSRKYDEASETYNRVLQLDKQNTEAMMALASIAYARNDQQKAEGLIQTAQRTGKVTRDNYVLLAFDLLVANKNVESARYYEKALKISERGVDYYNLACAYAKENNKEPALKALEKSVSMGYGDKNFYQQDADLNSLKDDKRFEALLEKFK